MGSIVDQEHPGEAEHTDNTSWDASLFLNVQEYLFSSLLC